MKHSILILMSLALSGCGELKAHVVWDYPAKAEKSGK
jgi:hypothetical protein